MAFFVLVCAIEPSAKERKREKKKAPIGKCEGKKSSLYCGLRDVALSLSVLFFSRLYPPFFRYDKRPLRSLWRGGWEKREKLE